MSGKSGVPCPRGEKLRCATVKVADGFAHDLTFIDGKPSEAFPCECGWYHIGHARNLNQPRKLKAVTRSAVKDRRDRHPQTVDSRAGG